MSDTSYTPDVDFPDWFIEMIEPSDDVCAFVERRRAELQMASRHPIALPDASETT